VGKIEREVACAVLARRSKVWVCGTIEAARIACEGKYVQVAKIFELTVEVTSTCGLVGKT
jgi:hypothetical protein